MTTGEKIELLTKVVNTILYGDIDEAPLNLLKDWANYEEALEENDGETEHAVMETKLSIAATIVAMINELKGETRKEE